MGEKEDIRQIPSVIGGDESRRSGIVLAKSTIAKKFGVVTGETLYSARRKCPQIKVYPVNFKIYEQYSNKLYNLLLEYTDKIERFSIDECFLDMTEYLIGDKLINKANEINKRAEKELGFTVNVGVANNKLLAKMASDFEKPNKVHTLFSDEIETKLWPLKISDLFMLGKKTVPKLYNMGIKTIGELAKTDEYKLIKIFGKYGKMIWEYANGIDNSEVNYKLENPKGIGNSITLPIDISNIEKLEEVLLELTEQVTYRLRKHKMIASTVSVQLRDNNFNDFSHQKKLFSSTSSTKEIYFLAKELLNEMYKKDMKIRLIGMRVDKLTSEEEFQISLFEKDSKQENIDKAMDLIKEKYGYESITRAKKINIEDNYKLKKIL
ncbi:MAG: Y-family DNA polymerase [Candidatus Scatovivens sp.]